MNARAFWLSALVAGALMGLFANLPLLNLINCCLCIWIWFGGALAVYLYRRFHPTGVVPTVGQAALLGIVAGLIAAVAGLVVYTATSPISIPLFNSLARFLQVEGDLPFDVSGGTIIGSAITFFVLNMVLYPLFGALGAIIAASLMPKPVA